MSTSELSSLKDENRKLRAEYAAEIKLLQNKVLIAEEKAKTLLDQYSSTVAPLEVKKELWKQDLELSTPFRLTPPYIFDRPLSSNHSGDYQSHPYQLDNSKYRDNFYKTSAWEQPSYSANLYEADPPKKYLDREPSPIYRPTYNSIISPNYNQSYLNRSYQEPERTVRYISPNPSIRSYIDTEVTRSRESHHDYLPKTKFTGNLMRHSNISVGDDYLGRVSTVYPTRESQINSSFDRGSLRRKAVADSSATRTRPGESFLSEFKQKMQTIQL